MIGLPANSVSWVFVCQVLFFTLPAIGVGVVLSVGIYALLAFLLNSALLLQLPLIPPSSAFLYSILIGFFSPFIAILAPITTILRRKLVDSLDAHHFVSARLSHEE